MSRFKQIPFDDKTLHLTLSVLVKQDNQTKRKLISLQEKLLSGIPTSSAPTEGSIYKCKPETFHFSIINFATDKNMARKKFELMYADKKKEIIDKIAEQPKLLNEIRSWRIEIRHLFPGVLTGGQFPSIAANAFLANRSKSDIEHNLFELTRKIESVKIYYEEQLPYTAINLVRFLGNNNPAIDRNLTRLLEQRIDEISSELTREPILFNLSRLSLVVSDPYLFNPKPEIKPWILNT